MHRNQPDASSVHLLLNQPRQPICVGAVLALDECPGMAFLPLLPKDAENPRVYRAADDDPGFMSDKPDDRTMRAKEVPCSRHPGDAAHVVRAGETTGSNHRRQESILDWKGGRQPDATQRLGSRTIELAA